MHSKSQTSYGSNDPVCHRTEDPAKRLNLKIADIDSHRMQLKVTRGKGNPDAHNSSLTMNC